MNVRQQTHLRNALLVHAERELERSASRNDWIVAVVCLVGVILLGVFA